MGVSLCIILNVAVLMCDHHNIELEGPPLLGYAYEGLFGSVPTAVVFSRTLLGFTLAFALEEVLKVLTYGVGSHLRESWSRFEFAVVFPALLCQVAFQAGLDSPIQRVVTWFSTLLRVVRLLKDATKLKELLGTMVLSIPSLVNVSLLLVLMVYIYSVLGVQLFTYVRRTETLNEYGNFDSFGDAFTLLFQCLTGDGWSFIMFDCLASAEDHRGCSVEGGDCGGWWAIPYFVSFQVACCLLPATCYLLPATFYLLSAVCYLLPATCYLLHATCYLLSAVCYLLPATCYMLPTTCCLLSATCYMLSATCYLLPATCYMLPATCCLLHATCYLLPATCCLLPAVCCLLSATCYLLSATCYMLPTACYLLPTTYHLLSTIYSTYFLLSVF